MCGSVSRSMTSESIRDKEKEVADTIKGLELQVDQMAKERDKLKTKDAADKAELQQKLEDEKAAMEILLQQKSNAEKNLAAKLEEREKEMAGKEKTFKSIMAMVEGIYHFKESVLILLDSINSLKLALEQRHVSGDFTGFNDPQIKTELLAGGLLEEPFMHLWKTAGGTDKGMATKDYYAFFYVVFGEYNPPMFKHLIAKAEVEYPDEEERPQDIEVLLINWKKNTDAIVKSEVELYCKEWITALKMKDGETLPVQDFAQIVFEQLLVTKILPPSWDYGTRNLSHY